MEHLVDERVGVEQVEGGRGVGHDQRQRPLGSTECNVQLALCVGCLGELRFVASHDQHIVALEALRFVDGHHLQAIAGSHVRQRVEIGDRLLERREVGERARLFGRLEVVEVADDRRATSSHYVHIASE